ncbi:MAG: DUF4192 domain-containing protein [Candidatus Nanopelagicales bacterium]|jgi:hypothetical protein|nr:DUF4192 domain-containing protein [Candidatus Nanopelagicales bacterium]
MTITLDSPEAAAAATPYLLGFTPEDSLVLILLDEGGANVTMRMDLPWGADLEWLRTLLDGIPDPVPARAVLLVYAHVADAHVAVAIGNWLGDVLSPVMDVKDVLLVSDGCVRSVVCPCQECEDRAGIALTDLEDHPVVAQCVAAGLTRLKSRDDLESQLLPVDDGVSQEVAAILETPYGDRGDYEIRRDELESQALGLLTSTENLDAQAVAVLAHACADVHVRDPLLAIIIDRHEADETVLASIRTRLTYAVIHTPTEFAGPVAATLALLAWVDGDGASALVAADTALACDPENSLAPLVCHALQHGLPPTTWGKISRDIPMDVLRGRRRRSA